MKIGGGFGPWQADIPGGRADRPSLRRTTPADPGAPRGRLPTSAERWRAPAAAAFRRCLGVGCPRPTRR
jgi:hypothetical protein